MKKTILRLCTLSGLAIVTGVAGAFVAGCQQSSEPEDKIEEVGESIEEAADESEVDAVEEMGDAVRDATE